MRTLRSVLSFLLILAALVAAPAPGRVHAEPAVPDPAVPRLMYDGVFDLPRLPADAAAQHVVAQAPATLPPFDEYALTTRLAFQSVRNEHDWEAFVAAGNGNDQVNVSNDTSSSDIYPRLNPGATKVVFASTRYGGYTFLTTNLDGTGLASVVQHYGYSVYPSWSPDGTRLAYQWQYDQNSQSDIYVASTVAAGDPIRLTDYADYDGEPAWSPDGKQIAFTRRMNGQYRIWVMNADGSGAHQLSQQANSEHAAWSPDGQWIAYDADGNGDGWLELWLMDAAGGNQRMIYRPPENEADAMAGSWSPDGQYLAFTHVSWVFYQGDWYWTTSYIDALPVWTSGEVKRVIGVGADFFPDWRGRDLQPPVSAVLPLPPYSRAAGFTVSWQGQDIGPAGLGNYDVEYRIGTGPWTPWLTGAWKTSDTFTAEPGQVAAFRARGRDWAGNVEAWPAGDAADASTTTFSSFLSGSITDNRGLPVAAQPVSITPAPVTAARTSYDGDFLSRLAAWGNHTLSLDAPGYAPLALSNIATNGDRSVSPYLAPRQNLAANGTFEAEGALPAGWALSGPEGAATLSTNAHTGVRALQLGRDCPFPCLSERQALETSPTNPPDIATDHQGNLYLVSSGWDGSQTVVRFSVRSPDGSWSPPESLGPLADYGAAVAVDGRDRVHVVWAGPGGMYYRSRAPGQPWSELLRILDRGGQVDVAADTLGGVHVVYLASEQWNSVMSIGYLERLPSGTWQPAQIVDSPHAYSFPGVATGPDNSVHFIYQDIDYGHEGVFYRSRPSGGALGPVERLWSEFGYSFFPQRLTVGSDETVHAAFHWGHNGYYTRKPVGGTWSTPQPVSDYEVPIIAVDSRGLVYVAGLQGYGPYTLIYRSLLPDGTWKGPVTLGEGYPGDTALASDPMGIIHLVAYAPVESRTYYWTSQSASEAFTATASQRVSIPADMHRPTLAVNYAFSTGGSRFSMLVDDGVSQTEVFSDTHGADWQLAWGDLTPWAGKQVTVTLALTRAAGGPYGQVRVDDVTLGEWVTPVIDSIDPPHVGVRTQARIVIHGDNFMQKPTIKIGEVELTGVEWLEEHTVAGTLPSVLGPGVYDVWVTNPSGAASVRGQGFRSGLQLYLPVISR